MTGVKVMHEGKVCTVTYLYRGNFAQLPQVNLRRDDPDGTAHFFHGLYVTDDPDMPWSN